MTPPLPPTPRVRLVAPANTHVYRHWDNPLFEKAQGSWRLTGPAGSGVTSLVCDVVAKQIRSGVDPSTILVIATSKEAAAQLRRGITDRLSDFSFSSATTMVRSVHSVAFAILRQTMDEGLRLITGSEMDAVIRELLEGNAAERTVAWPADATAALEMVGFARGLRDFLLRALERGLGPQDLIELGSRYNRPLWMSAGQFLREYQAVMALSGRRSLSASELVSEVLLHEIPDIGARTVIVDDAQHLDPKSAQLVATLAERAELSIIAGDPEQAVFHFRGADPDFLRKHPVEHELRLEKSFRAPHTAGYILPTDGAQWEFVADRLRREHLLEGVAWKDMAVIVRSQSQIAPARRALLAAGVPVHVDPTDLVLSTQRIVSSLLLAVRALHGKLTAAEIEELALGPIGGADPVTLRRLYRGLRLAEIRRGGTRRAAQMLERLIIPDARFADERAELEADAKDVLTDREQDILDRVRGVLDAGRAAIDAHGSVEEVLWEIWHATGLSQHLQAVSLRGGAAGSQADRDLDAVMALFDAAGDFVERRPSASVSAFVRHIEEQELPTGVRDRRLATPDAVHVYSAHGTTGKQWHMVAVAGVQEDVWPQLGETGSLFGQEELVDLLDEGIVPGTPVSHAAARLAEEKRLFHLACTRATGTLIVTAVDAPDADEVREPSRFMRELGRVHYLLDSEADAGNSPAQATEGDASATDDALALEFAEPGAVAEPTYVRLLSVPSIVGELRRVVASGADSPFDAADREQAARQLARLAAAGVPGADPATWWAAGGRSESEELDVRAISPSLLETGLECPLRASLSRVRVESENTVPMMRGTLVHAFAEAVANGVDAPTARGLVRAAYEQLIGVPSWLVPSSMQAWDTMVSRLEKWMVENAARFELIGTEVPVKVDVGHGVTIAGRIDRLERSKDGLRILDLKTAKTAITKAQAAEHKQLAAYQLALSKGELHTDEEGKPEVKSGGGLEIDMAQLVYPAPETKAMTTREQVAKTQEELDELNAQLPTLLAQLRGPEFIARINPNCQYCDFHTICPATATGRMTPQ